MISIDDCINIIDGTTTKRVIPVYLEFLKHYEETKQYGLPKEYYIGYLKEKFRGKNE